MKRLAVKTPDRPRMVVALAMFQVVIGSTLPSGLYATYESQWGLTREMTTVIFSMYVVGVLVSLLFLGHLADRLGRKKVMVSSLLLSMFSSALFLAATNAAYLYPARLISGISVGICTGAFTAALGDLSGKKEGAAISALVTSGGLAVGPLASAVAARCLPYELRIPFVIHLALLAVVGFFLLRFPDTASDSRQNIRPVAKGQFFPSNASLKLFIVCSAIIGWAYGANGLWQSVVPLTLGGQRNSQIYIAALASLMLGSSALAQWFTLRQNPSRLATVGLLSMACGLIICGIASALGFASLLWGATVLVGVGQGLGFRGSLSVASHVASDQRQSTAISLYYVFGYLMTAAAPLATNSLGVGHVLLGLGLVSVVTLFAFKVYMRKVQNYAQC
ncbi:MFS transporter [Corynebacterium aquilae]|uniref:Major facilitator superfamily (MFS) profile domain-containing protein n=1 Tax=Corynebacterium aquilae DSM 44791 TaxID=1431546 RepID=A0A1L7CEG9_9CORY|nr:MFS transporter [Corynebacterium aquilae]APT84239.1 hypothetical protein CAQU_03200 [Corynebacterium aquilae DSM 44791]